jgi:hypothetical protein
MKKFIVTETRRAFHTWTYEVEAESEEQAIELVENGDVNPDDFDNEIDYCSDATYEVDETED